MSTPTTQPAGDADAITAALRSVLHRAPTADDRAILGPLALRLVALQQDQPALPSAGQQ